nr:hypothetical protein [Roseomonas fluvialis]
MLGVLLPLVLRHARHEVFMQAGVRVVAELDGGRFQNAARLGDHATKIGVRVNVAGEAGDIVDDDDHPARAVFTHEGEKRLHAGAIGGLAGNIVLEHADDIETPHRRELAAAGLLRFQAVPHLHLLGV